MPQSSRVSTTSGTVPTYTAFGGGTCVTDTNKTTVLIYTGTDVITDTLTDVVTGYEGSAWVYVIGATTNTLARVIGVTPVDESNPAALVYAILLDRVVVTGAAKTMNYIIADLKSYSVVNQTSTAGVFDGVALAGSGSINQAIQYPLNTGWLEAKTFDATSTSFLIKENK